MPCNGLRQFLLDLGREFAKYEKDLVEGGLDTVARIAAVAQSKRTAASRIVSSARTKDVSIAFDHAEEMWLQAVCEAELKGVSRDTLRQLDKYISTLRGRLTLYVKDLAIGGYTTKDAIISAGQTKQDAANAIVTRCNTAALPMSLLDAERIWLRVMEKEHGKASSANSEGTDSDTVIKTPPKSESTQTLRLRRSFKADAVGNSVQGNQSVVTAQ